MGSTTNKPFIAKYREIFSAPDNEQVFLVQSFGNRVLDTSHENKKRVLSIASENLTAEIKVLAKKIKQKKFLETFRNIRCATTMRSCQRIISGGSMQVLARQKRNHKHRFYMLLFQAVSKCGWVNQSFNLVSRKLPGCIFLLIFCKRKPTSKSLLICPVETCRYTCTERIHYKAHQDEHYGMNHTALLPYTVKNVFNKELEKFSDNFGRKNA